MQPKDRDRKPKFEIDYNNWSNATQIQNFINKQLWCAGGSQQTQANAITTVKAEWGGQSRFLAGFAFYADNIFQHTISINLNQETIIDKVPLTFLCPNGAFGNIKFQQYYEFIRPLSGSDTLTFAFDSTIAEPVRWAIYMTRAYNKYYTRD